MRSSHRGFTLVELIISISIAVLVSGLLIAILVNNTGLFYKQSSKISEGIGANNGLVNIKSSIKESQSVADSFSFSGTTYSSSSTQLVLKLPSIDSSKDIISNTFDYFVYYQNNDKLIWRVFPDPLSLRVSVNQILTENVQSLLFEYFNSAGNPITPTSAVKVRVRINLSKNVATEDEHLSVWTEVNLRNY